MQYEFLKNFPRRMKNVGLYAVLIQNSAQKMSWKQFGFSKFDEQLNLIFAVMLYIMEQLRHIRYPPVKLSTVWKMVFMTLNFIIRVPEDKRLVMWQPAPILRK